MSARAVSACVYTNNETRMEAADMRLDLVQASEVGRIEGPTGDEFVILKADNKTLDGGKVPEGAAPFVVVLIVKSSGERRIFGTAGNLASALTMIAVEVATALDDDQVREALATIHARSGARVH